MTIVGTRPEIIRLSRVIALLDEAVDHTVVHTGQNYDYKLSEIFFKELLDRQPDYFLDVDTRSLGSVLGNVLIGAERVLHEVRPDSVLILGDTNSSIAAIMAKRMHIPVYHMEAGNRCFDENVPEEINRRIIDHIADFNLVYSEHARRNLLAEGLPPRRIYITGSPLREVLDVHRERIHQSDALERLGLDEGRYFIVSMHREENVDNPVHLRLLLEALERLNRRYGFPVIVSTHPRTRNRMERAGVEASGADIRFLEPFGFFDYNRLQQGCFCALSDSGTISEESAILSFPAVTIRNAIERPEAMDTGSIVITGIDPDTIEDAVQVVTRQRASGMVPEVPDAYTVANCAQRVVNLIVGTTRLNRVWANLADTGPPPPASS